MGRRTWVLVAALVVAALGTVAVFLYAQNARQQGDAAQELETVLVARTQIAIGTTGSAASNAGAFATATVRKADVVPGALSDPASISTKFALVPIYPGQQIISPQWGEVATTTGLTIPPGKVAISVQLGDPQRVAGFVSPGSIVAILVSGQDPTTQQAFTRTLLANVPVIAVGPTTVVSKTTDAGTSTNTEQIPTAILTLALSQTDAEKVVFAQGGGAGGSSLYFALMNASSTVVPNAPGVGASTLFR